MSEHNTLEALGLPISKGEVEKWSQARKEESKKRTRREELLRFEASMIQEGQPVGGTDEMDSKFPRIDLSPVRTSLTRQKGIPFLVPRLAMLNLHASNPEIFCNVEISAGGKRADTETDSVVKNSSIAVSVQSFHVTRRRLRYLAVLAAALTIGVGGWLLLRVVMSPKSLEESLQIIFPCIVSLGCLVIGSIWAHESLWHVNYGMTTRFPGILPDDIRGLAKKALECKKFDQVALVFTPAWSVSTKKVQTPPDPLLVGLHKGAWYLLAQFDATPEEHWLASEFEQ
jgi:hypothetical protein